MCPYVVLLGTVRPEETMRAVLLHPEPNGLRHATVHVARGRLQARL